VKRALFFLSFYLLVGYAVTFAQPDYLIKIEETEWGNIDQIKATGIEIYTKTASFWIAGATQTQLLLLENKKIAYSILDDQTGIGEYYLVWSEIEARIESRLEDIASKSQILAEDVNLAVVKGKPREIEELASLGLNLRKIHQRSLPWEPIARVPSYLESLSVVYDPIIDSIVNRVDPVQLLSCIDDLSGEDTALIWGIEDSITTRYSYSTGAVKAAQYLKERFQAMGIPAEFDTFRISGPTRNLLDVTCAPDAQTAWSASSYGGIIRTSDGGNFWDPIDQTMGYALNDIFLADDQTLWCVGNAGVVIRSTDWGDNWESRSKPELDELDLKGCYFENADCGWVVGEESVLYTSDGGENWVEQKHLTGVGLFAVDFADTFRGWAVGDLGTILHTSDGGAHWRSQKSGTPQHLASVDFVDQLNGWVCGNSGCILYTTDGGINWIQKNLYVFTNLTKVFFLDSGDGWIMGYDGTILKTSDLGINWVKRLTVGDKMGGIVFANTSTGWATGFNQILKTTDGGQNWYTQYQNFEATELVNVVATIEGLENPDLEVIMTGHYDNISTLPYNWTPGADDNASGTVSLLAAADILSDYSFVNTVKFVAFCGEEQGILGSNAYAEEAYINGDTILGVLNLDMTAYDGNGDRVMEVHCGLPSENQVLGDIFIDAITTYQLDLLPEKMIEDASWGSDHVSFWDYGFTAISGGEDHQDFNPYLHTIEDRVSVFDTAYYVQFTKAAVAGVAILAHPFILGDTNRDMVIDLGDAVFLLGYLFKSQAAPDPLEAGDADCDHMVNLGDVVYLLNYLVKGGPAPGC
jgi:photosystem II stability/assembly factor-like uncharacterized protein